MTMITYNYTKNDNSLIDSFIFHPNFLSMTNNILQHIKIRVSREF